VCLQRQEAGAQGGDGKVKALEQAIDGKKMWFSTG
jgi:hypothetical protein